ncbi:MAG: hypothetical protein HDR52_04130 [Treponema sp.]|nr:hypothetical protein [Treponema sp.]
MIKLNARKIGMALCAAVALTVVLATGCKGTVSGEIELGGDDKEQDNGDKDPDKGQSNPSDPSSSTDITDGIDYKSDANGTLTIRNNTKKDMVLFEGETPTKDTILGGVRAQSSRAFNVSKKNDFDVGGWMIIKGMAASEYAANKTNLTKAKVEYSTMATYHAGEYYEATINAAYTGDYCFKVTNNSDIGIELHKDSFNGEKIAYLAPNKRNYYIYCDSQEGIDLFPVYVYYSTRTKTVTTLNSTLFDTVLASPLSVHDTSVNSYTIPDDVTQTLSMISASVKIPYAYIIATNNVPNQGARFGRGSTELKTQGGQDTVSGIPLTFEIASSEEGQETQFYFSLYGGQIKVFVEDAEGNIPIIKNGYDYTVTLSMIGADKTSVESYKATISTGTPRDIKSEIETLPQQQ